MSMATSRLLLLLAVPCEALVVQPARPVRASVQPARTTRIACGWGPDPIWQTLAVAATAKAADGMQAITFEVSSEAAGQYSAAGQYVQLRLDDDGKPGFFAIASPPDASSGKFEFLVKETDGRSAAALAGVPAAALAGVPAAALTRIVRSVVCASAYPRRAHTRRRVAVSGSREPRRARRSR